MVESCSVGAYSSCSSSPTAQDSEAVPLLVDQQIEETQIEVVPKRRSLKEVTRKLIADSQGLYSLSMGKVETGSPKSSRRRKSWSSDEKSVSFLRFTPALFHHWLHNTRDSSATDVKNPVVQRYRMGMLLLDISGFTRMSVTLGAELTRKHTSGFFEIIISCVRRYGGDVLKFLGDALLVAWPAELGASVEVQRHIAHCAASCTAEVMRLTSDGGYRVTDDIRLNLHGALAIGDVNTFDVGNHHRREFLVGGHVLAEIGGMESDAEAGTIIMSAAFANLLADDACLIRLKGGHVRLKLDSAPEAPAEIKSMISLSLDWQFDMEAVLCGDQRAHLEDYASNNLTQLEAHVPVACREFVRKSMLDVPDVVGQMRRVTTLFLALDALVPHLNSGDATMVQRCFTIIVSATRQTGGAVRQFVLDDKGCVAICAWGLPNAAHGQQDAARAIDCAFRILTGLMELFQDGSLDLEAGSLPHVGIASGEVYAGLIGSRQRCEYAMVGPSVNLAARLMGKACPWQVLVEESVRSHALKTDASCIFVQCPMVEAKGYDNKVAVFEAHRDDEETMCALKTFSELRTHTIDRFAELWDNLDAQVQRVGKVASVLAECPEDGTNDFSLLALVNICADLGIASCAEVKSAMAQLQATAARIPRSPTSEPVQDSVTIFRLTRGAYKGDPFFAFVDPRIQKWLIALITSEYAARVHRQFAMWIENTILSVEAEEGLEPAVRKARLCLLHHDLDAKLQYHWKMSGVNRANLQGWLGSILDLLKGCCTARPETSIR